MSDTGLTERACGATGGAWIRGENGVTVCIAAVPSEAAHYDALKELTKPEAYALGMGCWEGDHMLFPMHWFDHIPLGYECVDILGNRDPFNPENESGDGRFDVLSFGIVLGDGTSPSEEKRKNSPIQVTKDD